eukprot:365032-Chlamydomonas_euryale.AAC.22
MSAWVAGGKGRRKGGDVCSSGGRGSGRRWKEDRQWTRGNQQGSSAFSWPGGRQRTGRAWLPGGTCDTSRDTPSSQARAALPPSWPSPSAAAPFASGRAA